MKNEKYVVEYKEGFDEQGLPLIKKLNINANAMKTENGALVFYDSAGMIIYIFNMDVYVRAWLVS